MTERARRSAPADATTTALPVHVLVVEDSRVLRRLISQTLEDQAMIVDTADDGLQAVAQVARRADQGPPVDVVLMDVVMPNLNGLEATWQLRRNGYTGLVIMLTAADQHEYDMASSLCAGADDFLAKPFAPEQLCQTIRQHLHADRRKAESPASSTPTTPLPG